MAELDELRNVVRTWPVIDNHAHNLLLNSELEAEPFESITTEARGWALEDTHLSLAHMRAARQLKQLYGCDDDEAADDADVDWAAVLRKRAEWLDGDPDGLVQRCLAGTYALLIDDGLAGVATRCHPFHWHDQFTKSPTKRIVRIETLAEQIAESTLKEATDEVAASEEFLAGAWVIFNEAFEDAIKDAIGDAAVAGFKSVVCYRTGLDVEPDYEECLLRVGKPFERYVQRCIRKRTFKIRSKAINDLLVVKTMELLTATAAAGEMSKPVQFHCGLGDNDMSLLLSSPARLQPLIEQYGNVPVVLLHAAYPFTREAGYLATVFKHVYLDIGEVFPMVSRDGQASVVRQALELVPYSKLLWSTDGHFLPETYWLANKQFREVLEATLVEYASKGDISVSHAIELTKSVLFENSNRLYRLNIFPAARRASSMAQARPRLIANGRSTSPNASPVTRSAGAASAVPKDTYNAADLHGFLKAHDSNYVYVQWIDYMGTMRTRILPVAEFTRLVQSGQRIGISRGNVGTLQNDRITPAVNTTGQLYVEPDLRSLRPTPAKDPLGPSATVMAYWRAENGAPAQECPRGALDHLLQLLSDEFKVSLLLGFEIELVLLRRVSDNVETPYQPLTTNHAWGTLTTEQYTLALPALAEMVEALASVGIYVQQFHAESGPGQYEFILPPLRPLAAIDQLYQARQIISQVAETRGLRATLHPSPFSGVGTAAHAHVSLHGRPGPDGSNKNDTAPPPPVPDSVEAGFWAGVLSHLPAVCAFALPERDSYARVADNAWAGGTWIAWGSQNRETPLRKVGRGRWELRCLDGCANMFLAVGAVVGAGLLALRKGWGLENLGKDCDFNPARASDEQRLAHGITRKMPPSIDAAVDALQLDGGLMGVLPPGLARDYVAMKREEQTMLAAMSDADRRVWMIERY